MISFLRTRATPRRRVSARSSAGPACPICGTDHFDYLFAVGSTRFSRCIGCELVRLEQHQPPSKRVAASSVAAVEAIESDPRAVPETELLRKAIGVVRTAILGASSDGAPIRIAYVGVCTAGQKELALQLGAQLTEVVANGGGEKPQSKTGLPPLGLGSGPLFDACILGRPIEAEKDPLSVLKTIHRLLTPTGVLIIRSDGLLSTSDHFHGHTVRFGGDTAYLYTSNAAKSLLFAAGCGSIKVVPAANMRLPGGAGAATKNSGLQNGALIIAHKRYEEDPTTHRNKLSIIMPVFNEKATFRQVFDLVHAKQLNNVNKEIIIVESNSSDGTREDVLAVANHLGVTVILEEKPRGKGHAVRQGLQRATGDFIIIQDADLEYDIEDYDLLIDPLVTNRAAFILGIRHGARGDSWKMREFKNEFALGELLNVGHILFTTLFNVVYGQRLADPFTMFKVFRRDCIEGLTFECNRFDFDWELVAKLVRRGYIPVEIPVNYMSRSFGEGKKVAFVRDPITWIRACFKYRFTQV